MEKVNRVPISLSLLHSSLVLFYEESGKFKSAVTKNPQTRCFPELRDQAIASIRTDAIVTTFTGPQQSRVLYMVDGECRRGRHLHGDYRNHFHAWAVIKEELDEFWESVYRNAPDPDEIVQVAATSLRVLLELENRGIESVEPELRGRMDNHYGYPPGPIFTSFMDFYAHLVSRLETYWSSVRSSGRMSMEPLIEITVFCLRALTYGVGTQVPL